MTYFIFIESRVKFRRKINYGVNPDFDFSGNIITYLDSCSTPPLIGDRLLDRGEPQEKPGSPMMQDMGNLATMGRHDLARLQARLELQMRKAAKQRDYNQAASIQSQVGTTPDDNLVF